MSKNTEAKPKMHKVSPTAFVVEDEKCTYSISSGHYSSHDAVIFDTARNPNWEDSPQHVAGKRIIPYGPGNDLPVMIRDLVQDNHLAPGILQRQKGLLYGQGPHLYRNVIKGSEIIREWVDNAEILAWLRSWGYERFIERAIVDVLHTHGYYALHLMERGRRIGGRPFIAALKFVSATMARLEWTDSKDMEDVRHIYVGEFENACIPTGVRTYPVYDPRNPEKHAVSASYNYIYTFGRNFYATPAFMGAIRWILRGSDIPQIFKHVTDNGLNLAYHIHSPSMYWEKKLDDLRTLYPDLQDDELGPKMAELKVKIMEQITEVLSGKRNAGKFFESIDFYDENGNLCSWKIEAVDQKIKDFVESQLKIGEAANSAITSGMQLHPSLTNIVMPGTLGSGSQMLYALKIHQYSDSRIPEMVILDPINQAIRFNFNTDIQLGFYHKGLMPEEEVDPENRIKNS